MGYRYPIKVEGMDALDYGIVKKSLLYTTTSNVIPATDITITYVIPLSLSKYGKVDFEAIKQFIDDTTIPLIYESRKLMEFC